MFKVAAIKIHKFIEKLEHAHALLQLSELNEDSAVYICVITEQPPEGVSGKFSK